MTLLNIGNNALKQSEMGGFERRLMRFGISRALSLRVIKLARLIPEEAYLLVYKKISKRDMYKFFMLLHEIKNFK